MKFFIPGIDDPAEAEKAYQQIRANVNRSHRVDSNRRIYSITFDHKGKTYTDTVGELSPSNRDRVMAILEMDAVYLTCTPFHGATVNAPMMAGKNATRQVIYFDEE